MNPFEQIEKKIDLLELKIGALIGESKPKRRIVSIDEFSKYTQMSKPTIYKKFTEKQRVPGAFKPEGSKKWFFNLDKWDAFIDEQMQKQA